MRVSICVSVCVCARIYFHNSWPYSVCVCVRQSYNAVLPGPLTRKLSFKYIVCVIFCSLTHNTHYSKTRTMSASWTVCVYPIAFYRRALWMHVQSVSLSSFTPVYTPLWACWSLTIYISWVYSNWEGRLNSLPSLNKLMLLLSNVTSVEFNLTDIWKSS